MRAKDKIKHKMIELLKTTPADQISVKAVVMETNISKQTFYNNFACLTDAFGCLVCDMIDEALENSFNLGDWMSVAEEVLRSFTNNRDILMNLWDSKWRNDITRIIADHIYPVIISDINSREMETNHQAGDEGTVMIAGICQDIFIGLIKRYMSGDMEKDPGALINVYRAFLKMDTGGSIRACLHEN